MKDGKYVILCVDDDKDILEQLQLVLETNGYLPVISDRAAAGLAAYEQWRPDALIVDLMMEDLDSGVRLIEALRESGSVAPIFMLSSVGDQLESQVGSAGLKIAGTFQKPLDPEALLSALKRTLTP